MEETGQSENEGGFDLEKMKSDSTTEDEDSIVEPVASSTSEIEEPSSQTQSKANLRYPGASERTGEPESHAPPSVKLEDQMNNENLEMLQKIFEEADQDGGGGLDLDEFKQAMIKTMGGRMEIPDDNQLAIIFMKVDANCDGTVDWEEFCSYMLMENQLKDVMTSVDREMEFPYPAKEIPSAHRDTLTRITYFPKMSHGTDDLPENNVGRYVSVSKDGAMQLWTMDLHPQRTIMLNQEGKVNKTVWITDCVVLPNVKKIAVSSAEREIAFYDCSANSFEKQFVLSGLQDCVLTMDYWYNPQNLNESVLFFGDAGGSVGCIKFSGALSGLFDLNIGQSIPSVACRRVPFPELLICRHPHVRAVMFKALHEDWVRKVKYYPTLQCFISCATATNRSMYLGDIDRKKTNSVFRLRKGITSFDYCKEWNVIVTGSMDHFVRLWNPYVTNKPTSLLKGHSSAVTHIIVNSDAGEIISASQDKVIKIWDMRDLCCVQTIPSRSLLPGPHLISCLYYSQKTHSILVGTNQLMVLEGKSEEPTEEHEITSHAKPVCAALYNDLFNQVVSACHDSVVCVWNLETGEKVIQFANAHDGSEITAMSFDPSKRRLVTGARDGTVKTWNFNNGQCLSELQATDDSEITGILCHKQKIVTVGWSKKVTLYKDSRDEEEGEPRVWSNFHKDDILSIDLHRPSRIVASSSYDGDIKVWSLETGHVSCVLNANQYAGSMHARPVIPLELKRKVSENNAVFEAVTAFTKTVRHDPLTGQQDNNQTRRWKAVGGKVQKQQRVGLKPEVKTSTVPQQRGRIPSISPVVAEVQVKESDHDSVVDKNRSLERETATLLTNGSGGWIRAWSIFGGGLLGQFMAAHGEGESVLSMAGTSDSCVLATGDTLGYIKVWDISSYCITKEEKVESKPTARVFARTLPKKHFIPGIRIAVTQATGKPNQEPRDKRVPNSEPPPMLMSFRAHLMPVVSLDFVEHPLQLMIISASRDCSVRLWTHSGRYIGTFGQKASWDIDKALKGARKLPHDIHRVASANTLRQLRSTAKPRWRLAKHIMRITAMTRGKIGRKSSIKQGKEDLELETAMYLKSIDSSLKNVLGKCYQPKTRHRLLPPLPKLKYNHNQVVVYSSLPYKELESIELNPKAPGVLRQQLVRYKSSTTMLHDSQGLMVSGSGEKGCRGLKNQPSSGAGHTATGRGTGRSLRSGSRGSARRNHSIEPIHTTAHAPAIQKK